MAVHTVRTEHGELTLNLDRDYIEIEAHTVHELDPAWEHVDAQGHRHTNLDGLVWFVTAEGWCDDCRDVHEEHEWRCLLCRDVVEPRYITVNRPSGLRAGLVRGSARLRGDLFAREWALRPAEIEALGPALSTGGIDGWVTALMLRDPDLSTLLAARTSGEEGQTLVEWALALAIVGIVIASAFSLGWL